MWHDDEEGDDDFRPSEIRELHEVPLRRKAHEISRLTQALVQSLSPPTPDLEPDPALRLADDDLHGIGTLMLENGFLLSAKMANARVTTDYGRCMELAVLIKTAAEGLLTQTALCRELHLTEPAYLQALRDELDEFRQLFRAWVPTFDRTDHYDDGWGLFDALLPPGNAE